jgi:phage anti-repressor protein
MFETFETKLGQSVKMTDLYDLLDMAKSQYSRFIKKELIDSFYFEENKDYLSVMSSNTIAGQRGQHRQEYHVNIDAAKKLCMVSRSKKGNEIRDYLVRLTKQVETHGLVNHAQVLQIIKMVKIFAIYEYRQEALKRNKENYLSNNLDNNNVNIIYAKFFQWRNIVLQTGKEVLAQRVKEYCLLDCKRIPARYTQDEAFTLMGEYEQIKNAIWDLLSSKNKSEETINNICSLSQQIAKEIKPYLQRLNESDLFFKKIENNEVVKALDNF